MIEQSKPTVAIVILNYNGKHYLEKFLPSVVDSTYAHARVIVADNASTDDSLQFLASRHPNLEIIILTENFGFAKGYNEALKQVTADYYILLNSDVEVTPGWIEPMLTLMEADKNIAACQPKLLSYENKDMFEYAGAAGGWIDSLGYPFSRGRIFDYCERDFGQYDAVQQVFWASGAAKMVRANVYHELNGLDEYFFAHQEEIDLCWRMQTKGYKIFACPQAVVYHVGGGTLPNSKRKVYLNFRNNLVMITKNMPLSEKIWKLPLRIGLDKLAAFRALLSGDTEFFAGVLKGLWHYLGWVFSRKSKNNFTKGDIKKFGGKYNGSLIWAYFIRKKKTFGEIVSQTQ
jgi:GT2 family glycosyltransferase